MSIEGHHKTEESEKRQEVKAVALASGQTFIGKSSGEIECLSCSSFIDLLLSDLSACLNGVFWLTFFSILGQIIQ